MATLAPGGHRRFDIGRVLGNAFDVIVRNPALCLGLAFVIAGLPQLLFRLLVPIASYQRTVSTPTSVTTTAFSSAAIGAGLTAILIFGCLALLLNAFLTAAITRAAIEHLSGRPPRIGECLGTALSLILPTLVVTMAVTFASAIGWIFLVVPGVILWLGWSVAVPVLVQERLGILGSMTRSRALARGSKWMLFLLYLLLIVIVLLLQAVFMSLPGMLLGIGGAIVAALVSTVWAALLATISAASYVELREVKEGTGVQDLASIFA